MKKAVFLLISLFTINYTTYGVKVGKIDVMKRPVLACITNEGSAVVFDRWTKSIYVYSLNHFKLICKFGGMGEGPGELKRISTIAASPKVYVVSAFPYIHYFTHKGTYIKSARVKFKYGRLYYPLNEGFLTVALDTSHPKQLQHRIYLSDQNLENYILLKKAQTPFSRTRRTFYDDFVMGCSDGNLIFIGDTSEGFHFVVYNRNGKKLYEINHPYEPQKIPKKIQRNFIKMMRSKNDAPGQREAMRKMEILFPKHYPAYINFNAVHGKLFVLTNVFDWENKRREITVLDYKGKFKKKVMVSIAGSEDRKFPLTIHQGRYYFLKYNPEEDDMEIHYEQIM